MNKQVKKMTNTLEKKFVSEDGFDLCVLCTTKTGYKTETPVDQRQHYVDGAGQTCAPCYGGIYGGENRGNLGPGDVLVPGGIIRREE